MATAPFMRRAMSRASDRHAFRSAAASSGASPRSEMPLASSATSTSGAQTAAAAAKHAPTSDTTRAEYAGAAVRAGLVAAAGVYLPCSFLPLARKEAIRIDALGPRARPWHFFHPWKLLALCICIPSAVAVAQYVLHADSTIVGSLVYGGNVVPVSLGLGGGAPPAQVGLREAVRAGEARAFDDGLHLLDAEIRARGWHVPIACAVHRTGAHGRVVVSHAMALAVTDKVPKCPVHSQFGARRRVFPAAPQERACA